MNLDRRFVRHAVSTALVVLALAARSLAATPAPGQKPARPAAETRWRLALDVGPPLRVTLRADGAPLPQVVADLGQRLRIPITLAESLRGEILTVNLEKVDLESGLGPLARRVYVDYVLASETPDAPVAVGAFLSTEEEAPPPGPRAATTIMMEGDTEDPALTDHGPELAESDLETARADLPPDRPVLRVAYHGGLLTVRARRQPLAAILYAAAEKMRIPFALETAAGGPIDMDLVELPVEQLPAALPPGVRLYVRKALDTGELKPQRIVLAAPGTPLASRRPDDHARRNR